MKVYVLYLTTIDEDHLRQTHTDIIGVFTNRNEAVKIRDIKYEKYNIEENAKYIIGICESYLVNTV